MNLPILAVIALLPMFSSAHAGPLAIEFGPASMQSPIAQDAPGAGATENGGARGNGAGAGEKKTESAAAGRQDRQPADDAQDSKESFGSTSIRGDSTSQPSSKPSTKPAPRFAERFSFKAIDGTYVTFPEDFAGKMVLITVWSTTCQHSREEIPFWKEAYEQFHKYGFEIVGILIDKTREKPLEKSLKALQKNGITWPIIYDEAPAIADLYKVDDIPYSFMVDGDTGRIMLQKDQLRGKQLINRVGNQLIGKKRRMQAATQPASQPSETAPGETAPSGKPGEAAPSARPVETAPPLKPGESAKP